MICKVGKSIEENQICQYLSRCSDEIVFADWLAGLSSTPSLILAEGFEERSLGIIEQLAVARIQLPVIVIGRYVENPELNAKYRNRFETAAEAVAPGRWHTIDNHNDGIWVRNAIEKVPPGEVLLDITGLSNRGLFAALDAICARQGAAHLGYTEAAQYWPKGAVWDCLRRKINDYTALAEEVDKQPWLFGYEHKVDLVPNHEGYDSAGGSRALVAFLPFKRARLAAVLKKWEYARFLFIAGRPRLLENAWRLEALKEINAPLTGRWTIMEMATFGYRAALASFADVMFGKEPLMQRYDVHVAILGSKLQNFASWILSCLVPAITVVTSVPEKYFAEAFSEGIGISWAIDLATPILTP